MTLKRAQHQWRNGERVEELQERWIRTYNLIAQHKMLTEVNRVARLKSGSDWSGGNDSGSGPSEDSPDAGSGAPSGGQMTTGQV